MSRLQKQYKEEILPALQKELGQKNPMAVPKIEKITINMGLGSALGDKKILQSALEEMSLISGQKPMTCIARKSVASFKLREGNAIGCKVTLRKEKMYEFLDRLVNIAIPRIRDFRGLNEKSFDGRGNYNMGLTEQIVFPEIDFEKVTRVRGMDIAITTSAQNNEDAKKLLAMFNFPFKDKENG
ncbi:LSU ribosomal protein L5p (L11e) [Bathymodiolus thermophilus thioautotrophic gill symbiont]|uniref:Large ribosomal subunit protein uL5 n=1 Tax=Bathymodiolus thermophilus thioautotrophic gill symbiont TaxID=2360 RepID=A0A1J5TUV2_9GAMM|nr:50S ribosomal protein L5 [Bathymodiolus thermophilus thioautotrophic gill symbiont]OIR24587.1 50S ribosomal protein L5 [Bathymodiolus thermophilus thioautotrophic gill symbiont]CAB5504852.1 LSU ribosomal protein L5p (L11e) [Bathymodiolus thermophilus thioautotrophic gill symbiont]SGZ61621.1 LSU ribosomal protein L5p (L11e) [Bathymodiolus thermophilus thioautotrophic gill symbiont]